MTKLSVANGANIVFWVNYLFSELPDCVPQFVTQVHFYPCVISIRDDLVFMLYVVKLKPVCKRKKVSFIIINIIHIINTVVVVVICIAFETKLLSGLTKPTKMK